MAEQDREDVALARKRWKEDQQTLDPLKLVFIDESGISTNMTRRYGRAPQGERLIDKVPHRAWHTTTFIAALRCGALTAPFLLDGPMDRAAFVIYIRDILAPSLLPGDIVVMDNLSVHKSPIIEMLIQATGATLRYLPPYSPDFNPIEQVFAKLKALLRSLAKRTITELWDTVASLLSAFSSIECRNYFVNSGYKLATEIRDPL